MTKALCSLPKEEQSKAIDRRVSGNTQGLGYWAAVDAKNKRGTKESKKSQQ